MMPVRPIRAFLAIIMAFLWMVGGSHCEVSAACAALLAEAHPHGDCDGVHGRDTDSGCDDCSLCAIIEGGLVPLTSQVGAPAPSPADPVGVHSLEDGLHRSLSASVPETPPPPVESAPQARHFRLRLALPARAPSAVA